VSRNLDGVIMFVIATGDVLYRDHLTQTHKMVKVTFGLLLSDDTHYQTFTICI
jgi:hypothetical protein